MAGDRLQRFADRVGVQEYVIPPPWSLPSTRSLSLNPTAVDEAYEILAATKIAGSKLEGARQKVHQSSQMEKMEREGAGHQNMGVHARGKR